MTPLTIEPETTADTRRPHLTTSVSALAAVVATLAPGAGRSKLHESLAGVRIRSEVDRLRCYATNLDVAITASIPAEVEVDGDVVLPFDKLKELVARLPAAPVTMAPSRTGARYAIKAGRSRTAFNVLAEAPPEMPEPEGAGVLVNAGQLMDAVAGVSYAVAGKNDHREILKGVSVEFTPSGIVATAGTNHLMARRHIPWGADGAPVGAAGVRAVLVPDFLAAIKAAFADDAELRLTLDERHAAVRSAVPSATETRIVGRVRTGSFPDVAPIFRRADSYTVDFAVDTAMLTDAIRRAKVAAGDTARVTFTVTSDWLKLEAEVDGDRAEDAIPATVTALPDGVESHAFAASASYLLATLKALPGDVTRIQHHKAMDPLFFTGMAGGEPVPGHTALVAPMRMEASA